MMAVWQEAEAVEKTLLMTGLAGLATALLCIGVTSCGPTPAPVTQTEWQYHITQEPGLTVFCQTHKGEATCP